MLTETVSLYLNGEYPPGNETRPEGVIIAVDGGLHHLIKHNWLPDLLIGDLDSVLPEELRIIQSANIEIELFPREKDFTDFELALDKAASYHPSKIDIHGALGGRIDHELTNLAVFASEKYSSMELRIVNENQSITLIRKTRTIDGQPGDLISLIPFGGEVQGVTTHGLQYPLANETLPLSSSRGISNVMLIQTAEVIISKGLLLCVHLSMS